MANAELNSTPVDDLLACQACCCCIQAVDCTQNCVGFSGQGSCCCILADFVGCKPVYIENDDKKCCICFQGGWYCVKPHTCCKGKTQLCCMDSRYAFPCTDDVPCMFTCCPFCVIYPCTSDGSDVSFCCQKVGKFTKDNGTKHEEKKLNMPDPGKDVTDVNVADLRVCEACFCCINSCYCDMPGCCGCKSEGVVCCISEELAGCKPIMDENENKVCCVCFEGGQYCVKPYTCCMQANQFFCLDSRCAFPCCSETAQAKVPMICTCLPGCVLYPDFYCCKPLGKIIPGLGQS